MKKFFILATLALVTAASFGQAVDLRRKIEVSGVAEKEVTPDIIDVSISLQEYMDGKSKVDISQLENQLETAVKAAQIPKEDFTINNVSAYNYQVQKKKNPGLLVSKQYTIRFHDLDKFNAIVTSLNPNGVKSTSVVKIDYSRKDELRKQLLIDALNAAKSKAEYLLNGLNEKSGKIISLTESDNTNQDYALFNRMVFKSMTSQSYNENNIGSDSDIDVKKIKLSFQVNAVFEIAK